MTDVTFVSAGLDAIAEVWAERWPPGFVVTPERVYHPPDVEGVFAVASGERVALATWAPNGPDLEVVTLDALVPGHGYGRRALAEAEAEARRRGIARLKLFTTNDNLAAIGVYLRSGWRVVAVHLDSLDEARRLKPGIPLTGHDGIPLRDAWELVKGV